MTNEELTKLRAGLADLDARRAHDHDDPVRLANPLVAMFDEATVRKLLAALDEATRERDEATNRAAAAEKCAAEQADALRALHEAWTSGGQLAADMPIPFSHATTDEARAVSTHLVGMAATFLRNEVLANPDAQKRNSLCVTIVYGDEPWHLTMARETNDVSFGLLMQRQKQEVQRDLAESRSQLAALHAAGASYIQTLGDGEWIALAHALDDAATAAREHDARVRAKVLNDALERMRDAIYPATVLRAMLDEAENASAPRR